MTIEGARRKERREQRVKYSHLFQTSTTTSSKPVFVPQELKNLWATLEQYAEEDEKENGDDRNYFITERDARLSRKLTELIRTGVKIAVLETSAKVLELLDSYLQFHQGKLPPSIVMPLQSPDSMAENGCCDFDSYYIEDIVRNEVGGIQYFYALVRLSVELDIHSLKVLVAGMIALLTKGYDIAQATRNLQGDFSSKTN